MSTAAVEDQIGSEILKTSRLFMRRTEVLVTSCCGQDSCECASGSERIPVDDYARQEVAKKHKVVAVDLDGTLAEMYDEFAPDEVMPPRPGAKKQMQRLKDLGARIIINTCRGQTNVIKDWLKKHEIPYDFINHNPDQPEGSSDKIMADAYLDDRAVSARTNLEDAVDETIELLKKASLVELHAVLEKIY